MSLDDIKTLQMDHTSRCNIRCALCARAEKDWFKTSPDRNLDLTLEDYQIILEPFGETTRIFHCGNFGDVIASSTFDETFAYTVSKKVKKIVIATNGSLRMAEWWADLAKQGQGRLRVDFAIDGLSDTLSIYRSGARWEKVMENAKAFIEAGGEANWNFLVFDHNVHQIEEAKRLASDMGFSVFRKKYSSRFIEHEGEEAYVTKSKTSNSPSKPSYEKILNKQKFGDYLKTTSISCKFKKERSIFIDFKMKVWPCTWHGILPYRKGMTGMPNGWSDFETKFGKDFNSLRKHGWSLLQNDFFSEYLENSWRDETEAPRIPMCGRTCGDKLEYSSGYGANRVDQKLQT